MKIPKLNTDEFVISSGLIRGQESFKKSFPVKFALQYKSVELHLLLSHASCQHVSFRSIENKYQNAPAT